MDSLAQEIVLGSSNEKPPPYRVVDGDLLIIQTKTILRFLRNRGYEYPVTSSRRLIDHFDRDGFLVERSKNKTINGVEYRCITLSLKKLESAGVEWPIKESEKRAV